MEGLTIAVTFTGEAFMAGGTLGVLAAGLFFGVLCGLWNSAFRGRWSAFSQLVYAAGFFPAAISMRSLMAFTTAVLPVFGLLALAWLLRTYLGESRTRKRVIRPSDPAVSDASEPRTDSSSS